MGEVRFCHLERRRIDQALPELLEEALAAGWRAVVQASSDEQAEAVSERLWTHPDDSFLPHGSARDGDAEAQPVYLTAGDENPNGARLRVLLSGVEAAACPFADYERVVLLFEGRNEEAVAEARRHWSLIKATGAAPSYWREGDDGKWEKAR
ncbi:MAG: DNA polymerase III subunit chi [Bradyrhizobium sp.]|nr:MAG: DNA polymerase III subunit chi [Bradyrhizobium sp.]